MSTIKILVLMTSVTATLCAASGHVLAQMSSVAKPLPPSKSPAGQAPPTRAQPAQDSAKAVTVKNSNGNKTNSASTSSSAKPPAPSSLSKPGAKPVSKKLEKLEQQTPIVENGPEGGAPVAKTEMQSSPPEKQSTVPPVNSSPARQPAPPVYGQYPPAYGGQFQPQQNHAGVPGQPYAGQPYAQFRQPAALAPFQSYPPAQVYPGQPAYGYQPQYPMQRPYYAPNQAAPTGSPPQQLPPFSQQTQPFPQQPQQFSQQPPPFSQQQPPPFSQQQPPPFSNPAQRPIAPPMGGNDMDRKGSNGVSDNMTEFLKNVGSARQLIAAGNPAFAVEPLDTAVKLRPRNLSVYFYRGLAYDEAGDPSRAVKDYMESLERAKTVGMDSAELRTNLGNSYMKLNFVKDAIIEYQKAIQIDPSSGAAHLQLGRAQLMNGDYNDALKNLRRAESLGYSDASLPYLKALSLAALGAKAEARSELSALLSEDARDRSPQLHNLAQDLAKELK